MLEKITKLNQALKTISFLFSYPPLQYPINQVSGGDPRGPKNRKKYSGLLTPFVAVLGPREVIGNTVMGYVIKPIFSQPVHRWVVKRREVDLVNPFAGSG